MIFLFLENDPFSYHVDDYDQQEALPSSNMFVLSSSIRQSFAPSINYAFQQQDISQSNQQDLKTTPQRTSSSSSFLQETKQLLDMISTTNNQHLDLTKLTSEVWFFSFFALNKTVSIEFDFFKIIYLGIGVTCHY